MTEADAGVYICRVSNNKHAVEAKAILRVTGVVPRFDGESWLSLPHMKDAYKQFDIEVSFRPTGKLLIILHCNIQLFTKKYKFICSLFVHYFNYKQIFPY